jgi:hypothetical protein
MKYPPLPGWLACAVLAFLPLAVGCSKPVSDDSTEFTVLTYNVEHLFDVDGIAVYSDLVETDDENTYSPGHLLRKLQAISTTLKTCHDGAGPEIIAFNEFEIDFTPESTVTDYAAFLEQYRGTTAERMLTV